MPVGYLYVSETEPDALTVEIAFAAGVEGEKVWLKPSTGEQRKWNGAAWDEMPPPPDVVTEEEIAALASVYAAIAHASAHSEGGADPVTALGTVHFTNKIYAGESDDHQGQNKVVTIPDVCTLTFKKGILTKFELIVPP